MQNEESVIRLSADNIIEFVRDRRNELISKLLNSDELLLYVRESFNITEISNIKIEFIKRALKELAVSPIDLSHYGQIILEMRKTGSIVFSANTEKMFSLDLDNAIKRFIF